MGSDFAEDKLEHIEVVEERSRRGAERDIRSERSVLIFKKTSKGLKSWSGGLRSRSYPLASASVALCNA